MNIKLSPNPKTGRTYLSIVRSYRDKATGKNRAATIKSIGYLDELSKTYDNPIAHFKEIAKKMTEEENEKKILNLKINMGEELTKDSAGRKNFPKFRQNGELSR